MKAELNPVIISGITEEAKLASIGGSTTLLSATTAKKFRYCTIQHH